MSVLFEKFTFDLQRFDTWKWGQMATGGWSSPGPKDKIATKAKVYFPNSYKTSGKADTNFDFVGSFTGATFTSSEELATLDLAKGGKASLVSTVEGSITGIDLGKTKATITSLGDIFAPSLKLTNLDGAALKIGNAEVTVNGDKDNTVYVRHEEGAAAEIAAVGFVTDKKAASLTAGADFASQSGFTFGVGGESSGKWLISDRKFTLSIDKGGDGGSLFSKESKKGATLGLSGFTTGKIFSGFTAADTLKIATDVGSDPKALEVRMSKDAYIEVGSDGAVSGFNFAAANDSINLDSDALADVTPKLSFKTKYFNFNGTGGFSMATWEGKMVLSDSAGTFNLTGITDNNDATPITVYGGNKAGDVEATFSNLGDLGGGLTFKVGENSASIKGATIDSVDGGRVDFTGFKTKTGDIDINGAAVNAGTENFTYAISDKVHFLGVSAGLRFDTNKGLNVAKTGKASELDIMDTVEALTAVSIGSGVYSIKGFTDAAEAENDAGIKYTAAFTLDSTKGSATGFVFGGSGQIVFGKGIDKSFKLYDGGTDDDSQINSILPSVTSSGVVAVGKTGEEEYALTVNKGATEVAMSVESGTTTLDFSGLNASVFADVGFSGDGFTTIQGAADPTSTEDSETTTPLAGKIVVTGNAAEGAEASDGGIYFGNEATTPVALAVGNYSVGLDSGTGGAAAITVDSAADSLYSAGGASKVFMAQSQASLTDAENEVTYGVKSDSVSAYFTADTETGALTGFVFAKQNDALTVSEEGTPEEGFALNYQPYDTTADPAAIGGDDGAPVVDGSAYTITMTKAPKSSSPEAATFELSGLSAEATAGFGEASITFSDAGGTIAFDQDATVQGFAVASGSASLNATAAEFLYNSDSIKGTFSLDGAVVNIDAQVASDGTLIYSKDDKSLYGLGDGAVVSNAGGISKIYAPEADGGAGITFGDTEADSLNTEFAVSVGGAYADGNLAYFSVNQSVATGFTFMVEGDALGFAEGTSLPSGFTMKDGDDGDAFKAPIVYTNDEATTTAEYTIAKAETNFKIAEVAEEQYVVFDQTKITALSTDDGIDIAFNTKGDLVGIIGVDSANESVRVAGATEPVVFGEADDEDSKTIQIVGPSASFVYGLDENTVPGIGEVYAGSTVKAAGGVENIFTAEGENGVGTFTFGASTAYEVEATDKTAADGVQFQLDPEAEGIVVAGISKVDNGESITAAFFDSGSFSLNGGQVSITPGKAGTKYTFSGQSIAGLADKDTVVDAGNITDITTAELGGASATFMFGAEGEKWFSVEGDKDTVGFKVSGASVSEVSDLDKDATLTADVMEGLIVNDTSIKVEDGENVYVVGAESGISKVGFAFDDPEDSVNVAEAEGAEVVGVTGDGSVEFSFQSGGESFAVAGNSKIETEFKFLDGVVKAIDGLDDGEKVSGNFENGIVLDNDAKVQVTGDEDGITVAKGASGIEITDFSAGASIAELYGINSITTDAIEDGDKFNVGGRSFTFTGADEDGVTFQIEEGELVGINGVDATVTGDLNGIVINGSKPAIEVLSAVEEGGYNTHLTFEDGVLSGIVAGDTVVSADGVGTVKTGEIGKFTFGETDGQVFSVISDSGVDFIIDKSAQPKVLAVDDLTGMLSGDLGGLSTINGQSFAVVDTTGFGVIGKGKGEGLSAIYDLSNGAQVVNAGGAEGAMTNTEGSFFFGGYAGTSVAQVFAVSGDSAVAFALDGNKAVGVDGLSGAIIGEMDSSFTVNDKTFEIVGDKDNIFVVAGTNDESGIEAIAGVGGESGTTVEIVDAGGASGILTNAAGNFKFQDGKEFETDDEEVAFSLDKEGAVTAIDLLEGYAKGDFGGVSSVNGKTFDVVEEAGTADGLLKIVGSESAIDSIEEVGGVAYINNVGGAKTVVTNTEGTFVFAEPGRFIVAGDSSVTFDMDPDAEAKVLGITGFGDEGPATITGALGEVSMEGVAIDITGDADNEFSYETDGNGNSIIGEVGGLSGVVINGVGGASKVKVVTAGEYAFPTQKYELGADSATFAVEGTDVTAIEDLNGVVFGDFTADGFKVNGQALQIAGDSTISVEGIDGSAIENLARLCDGAQIIAADGVTSADTASDGTFTFADGRVINIKGDSAVNFTLDGKGNLVSINDLDEKAVLSGDLHGILIDNAAPSILVIGKEGINTDLTLIDDTLFGLVDGDTVVTADGISAIATKEQGEFTFGLVGGASFAVLGDSYIEFSVEPGTTNVTAIKELDGARDILVVGKLNGIPVNGTSAIDIQGDTDEVFGVFAHANGIAAVGGVGGSAVTINSAGGASRLFTSEVGEYTFASGQKFRTYGDSFVDFDLDGDKVTGIGALSGAAQDRFGVRGDFTGDGVTVNRELVQVEGDDDIIVAGDDRKVTGIGYFNADATLKAWGSASGVFSKGEGEFTFDNGELPAQVFNVAGDSLVAFIMGASTAAQAVVGIEGLEQNELKFDTGTKELTVNKEYNGTLTFDTEEDVTLSIEDFKIVGISGITGGVSGVENAVINASGPINVNGKAIDVTDSDNSYKVEVTDGEAGKITDVTADAIVNVANATVETDPLSEGVLDIGGESYTFTDEDGITFETDENGLLSAVAGLSGTMEIPDGTADLTINGDALDIANGGSAPVTVTGDDNGITAIDRLTDGAVVNGDVEDAAISTYGNSSTLPADAVDFSINGNDYALIGDEDGVTVKGNEITGLDDNASLRVGDAGEYNVNGEELDADAGDVIVGDGEDGAYIYDPVASPVRVNTPEEEIMDREGVWNGYETQILPPPEGPLDAAGLSAALKGVDLNQPIEIWTTNGDSKTPQNLDFENYDGTKKVHLYDGPQAVEFNDEFGNMVHVEKGATGKKVVEFGDGGNLAIMDENGDDLGENQVGFIGGASEDTYYVRGTAQTNIDMGGADGGADKVHILPKVAARVTLEDYDYTSGAGIAIEDRKAKDIAQAIEDGFINFGEGTVEIGEAIVDVGQQAGGTMVNLFALGSEVPQAVGFTGSEGGEVGDANAVADLILIGNKDGKKTGGSNLIGGGGNDTAFLGAGDYANLGGGSNVAILDSDTNRGGAELAVTPQRLDIYNMNNTNYEGYGDVLAFDLEEADMSFDGTNLIVEGEDFVAVAHDAKKAGGYDFAESADTSGSKLVSDGNYVNQLVRSNGELVKTAIGAQSSIMEVEQDEDIRATYYKGNDSGVTFGEYKGEVVVDLGGDWQSSSIDEDEATFIGINKLQAASVGDSKSQFKGSSENETLIAGVGYASMYGDGGNNHLYGYEGDDKEGTTTFMVLGNANGAANTIEGFNWVEDDNYTDTKKVTADKIEVDLNTNHISTVDISGNDVVFTVTRNDDPSRIETAIVKDGVGKDIWFNDIREGGSAIVAQVGTDSVVFDKYANYYNAQEGDAVVEVDSALDTAQVYLDGSKGKTFVGNFKTIDAQDFAGKAELAGGYLDDVIYAGSGDNSLWGGKGGDDALLGGAGRDTFFYAFGNGTDTAVAGEGDVVELAGMTLDQLSGTKIDDTSIEVSFKDGGKLTVNDGGVSGIAFNVGGNTYYADHDTKSWSKKA